jgi:hypothetical protein
MAETGPCVGNRPMLKSNRIWSDPNASAARPSHSAAGLVGAHARQARQICAFDVARWFPDPGAQ